MGRGSARASVRAGKAERERGARRRREERLLNMADSLDGDMEEG
jgi:hypothetical protein